MAAVVESRGDGVMKGLRKVTEDFMEEVRKADDVWYSDLPYPCEMDRRIHDVIECYCAAMEIDRAAARQLLDRDASNCLWTYAKRMATQGVRNGSAEPIFEGLLALVVEDYRTDPRDTTMVLSLIVNAAVRVQTDPVALFSRAVKYATRKTADGLSAISSQYEKTKNSALMGFTSGTTSEGFTYF